MSVPRALLRSSSARRLLLAAVVVAGDCGAGDAAAVRPQVGAEQEGKATYYSDSLAGNSTASGEPYDPRALTAAHRTLPFGTRVRVTRLDNDLSVEVRINDRGPFGRRDRIIDLSRAAAEQLEMIRAGVVRVRLEVLETP
ncbi:MAG: septal ring lytic transglycosylase RlpA family protein [Deltaproteobacteria bacterium]|nr:septal ring lytic transglycosylase RlpA family protein [Deltaproteobacteria bacterium]